jgi:formylglycine-generating enzyme required for sulfatase activity
MRLNKVLILAVSGWLAVCPAMGGEQPDRRSDALRDRQRVGLESFAARSLPAGPNPGTWVDVERWCVAHARLATGLQTLEANAYFRQVEPVSLWHGLVADTDVQVTDLLRTWFAFRDEPVLEPAAKARLESFLRGWTVPNRDRNRDADTRYEWPCEYTENHSLNILTAAYLVDVAFDQERQAHGDLLRRFLQDRARYGWSEFHSPSYMLVTAKALACLYDFAPDPELARMAGMHLDLLLIQYAAQCVSQWRGVPFVRGYGSQVDNSANSALPLARLWFAAGEAPVDVSTNPFLVHLLTSRYAPPDEAVDLAGDPEGRGVYTLRMTGTTGPEKQRVPLTFWISPDVTMASAQGWGSYYDGCYWSISFSSSPKDVITGQYGKGRNLLQVDNVLIVFGTVDWRGGLNAKMEGAYTIGETDRAMVGQVDLDENAHVLLVATKEQEPDRAAMRLALERLGAGWSNGVVRVTLPDGRPVIMENERAGNRWRLTRALVVGREVPAEHDWLMDAPFLRSERDSGLYRMVHAGRTLLYDFRDIRNPVIRESAEDRLPEKPALEWTSPVGLEFVYIPSGEFPMGSSGIEGRENERPSRWVRVDGVYMSRTEVTVGQYRQFLAETPAVTPPPDWYWKEWGKTDRHAMTYVSQAEAQRFCEWLSKKSGRECRLPTEAEWEKAAKGYSPRVYPWGGEYDGSQAGTPNGTYGEVGTHPRDVSPFGVLDMAGGVWEWCGDAFDRSPAGTTWTSLRGCGWNFDPDTFRCAYRSGADPATRSVHIGFRVVAISPSLM